MEEHTTEAEARQRTGKDDAVHDVLLQYMCDFGKRLEKLEKVNNVANQKQGHDVQPPKAHGHDDQRQKKHTLEYKFSVRGEERVLKNHTLMTADMSGLGNILEKCGDDDKKECLYKGWLDMHKHMDKILGMIESLHEQNMDTQSDNGC